MPGTTPWLDGDRRLRFDDMLATLLVQDANDVSARSALWAQLVDILAQGRGGAMQTAAYARLGELRTSVSAAAARRAAGALAGRELPPALVALFAAEPPVIAGIVLASARMADADWLALLPTLGPTGRAFLRNRRDVSRAVRGGLAAFGAADLVIAGAVTPIAEPARLDSPAMPARRAPGPVPIGELVARIKAFRESAARDGAGREDRGPVPTSPDAAPITGFRFESDRAGVLRWVEGAPRAALIGETIALAGERAQGVDAHAAGAFRRRAPFRDARLTVPGDGAAAGDWRISAVPFFDPGDGRFLGYRGSAHRPRADQVAAVPRLLGGGIAPDALRQLVHELRTPLNAIVGFAEMIDGQMLGPAARAYRDRAGEIAGEGRRLLGAIDDLDAAARIEGGRWQAEPGPVDLAALMERLLPDYRAVAAARGATLLWEAAAALPAATGDAVAIERMVARLLGAVVALGEGGEGLRVTLATAGPRALDLAVARPRALAAREERELLDPGYSPEGEWPDAPLLGLGFTLRLVRNIAEAGAGALTIEPGRFLLRLPAEADSSADQEGSG